MTEIKHKLTIKAPVAKVYEAVTTQNGIESWWCKQTIAKPEVGFLNIFSFGTFRNEMKVINLISNKKAEWLCLKSIEEWVDTTITFDLEEQDGKTILRFSHSGWREVTDTFAGCNYDWGRFMISLKSYCETGTGTPS